MASMQSINVLDFNEFEKFIRIIWRIFPNLDDYSINV